MTIGNLIDVLDLDTMISVHASLSSDWTDERNPYFMAKPCREILLTEFKALETKNVESMQILTDYACELKYGYLDVTYA